MDENDLYFALGKTSAMLNVINTDLFYQLMGKLGMDEKEITNQIKSITDDEFEMFINEHESVFSKSHLVMAYLILMERAVNKQQKHLEHIYEC